MKLLHTDITSRTLGLTLGLALGTLTTPSLAAPVVGSAVTQFESGTTLSSADMNTTINALVTAINDNAASIATLEAGNSNVAGREYCLKSSEIGFYVSNEATPTNPLAMGASVGAFVGKVVFGVDNTGSLTALSDYYQDGFPTGVADSSEELFVNEPFTWTQTGNKLTLTIGDGATAEVVSLGVSKSGEVALTGNGATEPDDSNSGLWHYTDTTIAIEVAAGETCAGMFTF